MYYKFAPNQSPSGLIPPAVSNDGVAPCAPTEDPMPDWEISIEEKAYSDCINYMSPPSSLTNVEHLVLILTCRWAISKQRAREIISQARATIAAESEKEES